MNWIVLLLAVVISLLVFKNFKHHLFIKMLKIFAVLIIFIFILLVIVQYVNIDNFFNKDNSLSKTGAAVIETLKDNLDAKEIVKEADLNDLLNAGIDRLDKGLETAKTGMNN